MTAQGLDMKRDCPTGDCVIAKILDFRKIVHDPATAPEARAEALMFLVHFIGDMHQPLHCGRPERSRRQRYPCNAGGP